MRNSNDQPKAKGGGAAKNREGVFNPLGPGQTRWAPCVQDHDLGQGQLPIERIKVPGM